MATKHKENKSASCNWTIFESFWFLLFKSAGSWKVTREIIKIYFVIYTIYINMLKSFQIGCKKDALVQKYKEKTQMICSLSFMFLVIGE